MKIIGQKREKYRKREYCMKRIKGIFTLAFVLMFSLLFSACGDYEPSLSPEETAVPSETPTASLGPQEDLTGSEPAESPYTGETLSMAEILLISMQYTGDSSTCAMSAEQAGAFAALLKQIRYPIVRAALFDGGNGIPLLWVAHADREDYFSRIADFSLDGNYDDQIYAFSNGSVVECAWMTAVLRTGENGVIVQAWTPYESEFGQSFNMYHMTNGLISDTPFATGSSDIGGSYLNGQYVGEGSVIGLRDLYKMVESDLETLLEASSWLTGYLNLTGNWIDGLTMCDLLEQYAQL